MVSGAIDLDSWADYEELWQPGAGPVQSTECAHIFTEPPNVGMEDERKVPTLLSPRPSLGLFHPWKAYMEQTWTIIREFGYEDVHYELSGPNSDVHRLENIMTLTSTLHALFDKLRVWFEATVAPIRFLFCTLTNGPVLGYSKFV